MKFSNRIVGFSWAVLCMLGGSTALAQSNVQFAKANREYAAGDFKAAIADYEELVRSGERTANLFYDLGNAYFRIDDLGRAILNHERALALDPHHPEAEANLRIACDEARALELAPGTAERFFEFANANQYTIGAAIAFWVGAFSITALTFARKRSRGAVTLSILSLSIFAATLFAIYAIDNGQKGKGLAIVTDGSAAARLATADNANSVLTLPAGSEIKIISWRGDWIYAALPNHLRGWMPAKSVEQVRL